MPATYGFDFWSYQSFMIRHGYAGSTIATRMAVGRRWVTAMRERWTSATFDDVERWVAHQGVTAATQRNLVVAVRALYRYGMRYALVDHDATALVELPRLPRRLPRPAPELDIAQVLDAAGPELAAMVALMAGAGLRCVEVAGLTWPDVDLVGKRITVVGKGDKQRVLDVSDEVVYALAGLNTVDGPVFVGAHGRPHRASRVSQIIGEAFAEFGVRITAHQLRHRFATTALAVPDSSLLAVRDALGHVNVATTQIYTALVPGHVAKVTRAVHLPRL